MDFVVDVLRFELKMQSIIPLWSLTRKFQGFLLRTIRQVFSDFRILALRNFRRPAGLSRAHPVGPAGLMMSWNVFLLFCVFFLMFMFFCRVLFFFKFSSDVGIKAIYFLYFL